MPYRYDIPPEGDVPWGPPLRPEHEYPSGGMEHTPSQPGSSARTRESAALARERHVMNRDAAFARGEWKDAAQMPEISEPEYGTASPGVSMSPDVALGALDRAAPQFVDLDETIGEFIVPRAPQFVDLDETMGEFIVPRADYSFKDTGGHVREAAPISIGKAKFSHRSAGPGDDVILQLHGDETDAASLAENYDGGGQVFQVTGEHAHEHRNITVKGLKVDPNRVFSRKGAEGSLRQLNPGASDKRVNASVDELMIGSKELLNKITPKGNAVLYSLHNNQRGYNVDKAIKGSTRGTKKPGQSKHNFYLVTNEEDYTALANGPYNVVLQTTKRVSESETGSMSNVMAIKGKRYVNIETKLNFKDDPDIQEKMLDFAQSTLGGFEYGTASPRVSMSPSNALGALERIGFSL